MDILETTRRDVFDASHTVDAGGLLVLLCAPQPEPRQWMRVPPGTEVHFGRNAKGDDGTVDAPREIAGDPTLSRRHARLALDEGGAYLVDLGSTNGTWIEGRRLASHVPTRLPSGATFQVGARRFAWLDGGSRPAPRRGGRPVWLDREAFERTCLATIVRCLRYERPLSLLVLHERGVPAGSSRRAEPVWLECVDTNDGLGYVGPDEWALLLPECDLQAARIVAGVIQDSVQRHNALGVDPVTEPEIGVATLDHRKGLPVLSAPGAGGLAVDFDTVRLFLAAAREDRDRHAAGVATDDGLDWTSTLAI